MRRKDLRKELNRYDKERLARAILSTPKADRAIKKGLLIASLLVMGFMFLVITGSINVKELFRIKETNTNIEQSIDNSKEDKKSNKEDSKKKYYTIDEAQKEKSVNENTSRENESEYTAPNLDTDRKNQNILNSIVDDNETLIDIYNDALDTIDDIKDFKIEAGE